MAIATKPPKFRQKPVPFPPPEESATPQAEIESAESTPAEADPAKNKGGRPPKGKIRTSPTFWDIMDTIPREKWGPDGHAYIYLYIREPFCDIKTEGKPGYLMKAYEPIDPDFIMRRYGSGKYYLMLKNRPQGQKNDVMVADLTFEIYNYEHPPKIPREFWRNDSRNERWLALLPKDQQGPAGTQGSGGPAVDPNKWFDTFMAMQDRVAERMNPSGETTQPATQFAAIVDAATKIATLGRPPEGTAPKVDPWDAAEKILNMRSSNPMMDILSKQIETLSTALNSERDARTKLEAEMLKGEINALKEQLQKSGESELDRLVKMGEKKDAIAKALGLATDAVEHVTRTKMPWWADTLKETLTAFVQSPLAGVIAQRMAAPPQPGLGSVPPYPPPINVQPQPAAPQNGQSQPQAPNLMAFMEMVSPTMLRYFDAGREGDEFADWMYAGYPVEFAQVQKLQHPLAPGQIGAPVLVALYKVSPYWPKIAAREADFVKFAEEFCKWSPEAEEEDIPEAETENPSESEPEHIDV
jgi:hypothetical protein